MRPLEKTIARFVERLTTEPGADTTNSRFVTATVVSLTPLTVRWLGTNAPAKQISSYTPVVGHVVECRYNGAQLVVHGRII